MATTKQQMFLILDEQGKVVGRYLDAPQGFDPKTNKLHVVAENPTEGQLLYLFSEENNQPVIRSIRDVLGSSYFVKAVWDFDKGKFVEGATTEEWQQATAYSINEAIKMWCALRGKTENYYIGKAVECFIAQNEDKSLDIKTLPEYQEYIIFRNAKKSIMNQIAKIAFDNK